MANPNPKPRYGKRNPYRMYHQKPNCKFGELPQPPSWKAPEKKAGRYVDEHY